MKKYAIFLLTLFAAHSSTSASEFCKEGLRTQVENGTVGQDGSLQAEDGTVYPGNTFWQEDDFWWACPCLSGPCVRICAVTPGRIRHFQKIAEELKKDFNISNSLVDPDDFETVIWENDDLGNNEIVLKSEFKLVKLRNTTQVCTRGKRIRTYENTRFFKNGSLRNNLNLEMVHDPDKFCLFPVEWEDSNLAIICEPYETPINHKIRTALFTTSIFFLVLTLIVQSLFNKDSKRLHFKMLVNQCVSLVFCYICFAIYTTNGYFENDSICICFALFAYYFNLAACFWLNVMCYEIYSTFKNMCGYGKHNLKFKYLALYAWGSPLVLTLFAVLMQYTLPLDHFMYPNIGYRVCWFPGKLQQLIYCQGPTMVLFVLNMVFFVMTALVLRRLRRESSAALSTDDNKVHESDETKASNKSHHSMFLKLFLLMGCSYILEFAAWQFENLDHIWIYTDSFIHLRGVFIFWITCISNPSVRKEAQGKILKLVCRKE